METFAAVVRGVEMPGEWKPPPVEPKVGRPKVWREALGDGSLRGLYERPDEDVLRVWAAGVKQMRTRLGEGWAMT